MSLQRLSPYLFAAATGVASGYYIFKPFIDQEVQHERITSTNAPSSPTPTVAEEAKKEQEAGKEGK
ncbi:hypothetical protein CC2G_000505 [Coprinopsis cinerea AmutBmut pab1-1]|nr:hypothetical protein CC2G_000505 [Coprinopsis cinerea AmutBmut pab1-1]